MHIRYRCNAEQFGDARLGCRRVEQVIGAHDFFDVLVGIVDDDSKVVGGNTVVAPDHDVVDRQCDATEEPVVDDRCSLTAKSNRRTATCRVMLSALTIGEQATGSGVGGRRRTTVRSAHGLGDLPSRAEAFVGVAGGGEGVDRLVMGLEARGLHER